MASVESRQLFRLVSHEQETMINREDIELLINGQNANTNSYSFSISAFEKNLKKLITRHYT